MALSLGRWSLTNIRVIFQGNGHWILGFHSSVSAIITLMPQPFMGSGAGRVRFSSLPSMVWGMEKMAPFGAVKRFWGALGVGSGWDARDLSISWVEPPRAESLGDRPWPSFLRPDAIASEI